MNQQRCTTPDVLRGGICGDSGLRISHSGDSQLDRDSFSENSDSPLVRFSLHYPKIYLNTCYWICSSNSYAFF